MLIIADARMPEAALNTLEAYGTLIRFSTDEITYPAISGHPDIFFCPLTDGLIYAPNTPHSIIRALQNQEISLIKGNKPVGKKYPDTALYNALVNDKYLIHHPGITDEVIKKATTHLAILKVKQGYTRCNLVEVAGLYITGDRGIESVIKSLGLPVFFVDQKDIILPGCDHGFFGGCTGVVGNNMFVCGDPGLLAQGDNLLKELEGRGVNIITLYNGPLWDGGSIIFVDQKNLI